MPQIQQTAKGGVIIYSEDDFIGFASGYASSLYPKLGRGASWLSGVNPFLKGPGVLCPGLVGTGLTDNSNIAEKIANGIVNRISTNGSAWLIEAGKKIHQIANLSSGAYTISTTTPFSYTIETDSDITHYTFTVTSANATVGATYTNNGKTFTVLATIESQTTLEMSGTGAPEASGTLTKASGTGDATITFSAKAKYAAPVGEDIIIFRTAINTIASAVDDYIFYSYNDTTKAIGDIGAVKDDASATTDFYDDIFSILYGAPLGNNPHPMIVGDDQKLYIADGQSLYQITAAAAGANPTISTGSVQVPNGYVITSFTKIGTHLIIFAKFKSVSAATNVMGDAIAVFWDYQSLTSTNSNSYIYQLNDNEVTCGFNYGGAVGCFTQGRLNEFANVGYRSKLQIFEGGRFVPKFNFSQSAPIHGGVDIINNMVVWNSGGVVYSYGSPYPDLPVRVNSLTIGLGTSNGFLKALNGLEIYLSTGSGTSNEVFKQDDTFYASSAWNGLVADPLFPVYTQGQIEYIEVGFFGSASGGRTMTFTIDFDYGTSTKTILNALATVTAGTQILYRDTDTSSQSFPLFKTLKPKISWAAGDANTAAPKISYIKIYYSLPPLNT